MDLIIKSSAIPLHGYASSQQGGRPENQDDLGYADTPLGCLLIVCDGMGGGPGGRTASYIVKNEIIRSLQACASTQDRDLAFRQAAARAHQALEDKIKEVPTLQGMGSTFAAILVNEHSAVMAHAGDSRIYQFRGKRCIYRSQDHSLVAELVKHGALNEEQARISPQSNVITRGLGSTKNHVPEIDVLPYKKGDRFVICTDGVWGSMQHPDLLRELTQRLVVDDVVRSLSAHVDEIGFASGGTHDNHSMIMVEMEISSTLKPRLDKWLLLGGSALLTILLLVAAGVLLGRSCSRSSQSRELELPGFDQPTSDPPVSLPPSESSHQVEEDDNSASYQDVAGKEDDNLFSQLQRAQDSIQRAEPQEDKVKEGNQSEKGKEIPSQHVASIFVVNELQTSLDNLIDNYEKAKLVQGKTPKEAVSQLTKLANASIKELEADISILENPEKAAVIESLEIVLQKYGIILKDAQNRKLWVVASVPSGKYAPTKAAIGLMNRQIEHLKDLKDLIKAKDGNNKTSK